MIVFCSSVAAQSGDWVLNANGGALRLSLATQGEKYIAYLPDACGQKIDSVGLEGNLLQFRRLLPGATQWFRVEVGDGVLVGRFAHVIGNKAPQPGPLAYRYHVTGWNLNAFDRVSPVVFDLQANGYRGRLRLDRDGDHFIGRLKFYAYGNELRETLEEDVTIKQWDGECLTFSRSCGQLFTGNVDGERIAGKFIYGGISYPWYGKRAEVLTYGLVPKSPEDRAEWQAKTRRILSRLMMAGNPVPNSVNVEILADDIPPITSQPYQSRDDDPANHPQDYRLTELRLTYTIPTQFGAVTRVVHAYLAKPTTGLERYPLVLAVNGHGGSAWQAFDPSSAFWYGDAFARRGYMVLAVDIGHRCKTDILTFGSMNDRSSLLGYVPSSHIDDPAHGNGYHPSIKPAGLDAYYTDWEEDGERVWDVMRGLDYVLSRSDVDPSRVAVTGLSMGGEITSYVGALDTRITASIPAGYSPDLSVIKFWTNHGCWNWAFADIREYLEHSDLFALMAPRTLIVETGQLDTLFSQLPTRFTPDKQVLRRARVAYGDGPILHYLHPLGHAWQSGVAGGGLRYMTVIGPISPGDQSWQTNGDTATDGRTIFDYLN